MDDDSELQRGLMVSPALSGVQHAQSPAGGAGPSRAQAATQLRALSVGVVLQSLGAERDPKDPAYNWRLNGMRISLDRQDMQKWHDHNEVGARHRLKGRSGGYGAIDLVMYVLDEDFRGAVKKLGGDISPVLRQVKTSQRTATPASATKSGRTSAASAVQDQGSLNQVRRYLTVVRALPADVVDRAIADGRVLATRENGYCHAVFRLDEVREDSLVVGIGYALRGIAAKPFHGVRGDKGLFYTSKPQMVEQDGTGFREGSPKVAAFTESAIEALSYKALRAKVLAIATSGSAVDAPAREAARLVRLGYQLVAAYNADAKGDQLSSQLAASVNVAVTRDRPDSRYGKDWNDELKALRQREGSVVSR